MTKGDFLIGFLGKCAEAGMGFFDAAQMFHTYARIKRAAVDQAGTASAGVPWDPKLGQMPSYWNSIGDGARQAMLDRKRAMRAHDSIAYSANPKTRAAVAEYDRARRVLDTADPVGANENENSVLRQQASDTIADLSRDPAMGRRIQRLEQSRKTLADQTASIQNGTYTNKEMQKFDQQNPSLGKFLNEGGVQYRDPYSRRVSGYQKQVEGTDGNKTWQPANKGDPGAVPTYKYDTVTQSREGARNALALARENYDTRNIGRTKITAPGQAPAKTMTPGYWQEQGERRMSASLSPGGYNPSVRPSWASFAGPVSHRAGESVYGGRRMNTGWNRQPYFAGGMMPGSPYVRANQFSGAPNRNMNVWTASPTPARPTPPTFFQRVRPNSGNPAPVTSDLFSSSITPTT